jgi:DUF438 domain-containing protein
MEEYRRNVTFASFDQEKLKRMLEIKQLYDKNLLDLEEARKRMKVEVGKITPEEYAAAEQLLMDEDPDECRNEDVRTMMDVFDGLFESEEQPLPFGHTIEAYRRENKKMKELLNQADELAAKPFILNSWLEIMEKMVLFKVHFSRKQNQLYSALEREGFDRPTTTMWVYDDYIRDEINDAWELLNKETVDIDAFLKLYTEISVDLRDLMEKEEMILYPTSLKLISEEKMEELKLGDREIGFFMIDMPELESYEMRDKATAEDNTPSDFMTDLAALLAKHGHKVESSKDSEDKVLDVAEGKLTLEQINLLYQHLPVDISFVDENDIVKFYSDTKHRVFPRSKGVIGREVRNCHPPKSLYLVEEIIDKFRSGEQSKAEFWINKPGVFIYIIYVAIRDKDGKFRGVMEMMQDCAHIRAMEGEQRLLAWGEHASKNGNGAIYSDKDARVSDLKADYNVDNVSEDTVKITGNTKLKLLLQKYPDLKENLIAYNLKFSILNSPMAKVVLPFATIKMMSEQSGIPQEELIEKIYEFIGS